MKMPLLVQVRPGQHPPDRGRPPRVQAAAGDLAALLRGISHMELRPRLRHVLLRHDPGVRRRSRYRATLQLCHHVVVKQRDSTILF